jgi:hypothetical protein
MARFTDRHHREWDLEITIAHLVKLRDRGLDLNAVGKNPKCLDGLGNPETLGEVLWILCEPQASTRGIAPEQFTDGFNGKTIFAATAAMQDAIADFTQPPEVAETTKRLRPGALMKLTKRIQARMESEMERIGSGSNDGVGISPESSESIPSG